MSRRVVLGIVFAIAAAVLLSLSVLDFSYAPGAKRLAPYLVELTGNRLSGEHVALWLRKAYSIIAFGVAGTAVAAALRPRHRVVYAALLIAAVSAAIEVLQRSYGSEESFRANVFDVACGAAGGALGALAYGTLQRVVNGR